MGKGKGKFIRWCSILPKGFTLVEFRNFNFQHIKKAKKKLESRIKIPLTTIIMSKNFFKKKEKDYLGAYAIDFIELSREQLEFKIDNIYDENSIF